MSKSKVNKGSCNHYIRKSRKREDRNIVTGPNGYSLSKEIDRIVEELSEEITAKILKKFRIV